MYIVIVSYLYTTHANNAITYRYSYRRSHPKKQPNIRALQEQPEEQIVI